MSVESSRAPQGAKSTTGAEHRGAKKAGGADAPSPQAGGGFSALMSLLSATDPVSDVAATGELANIDDQNQALAQVDIVSSAMNAIANAVLPADTSSLAANGGASASSSVGEMPGLERRDVIGTSALLPGVGDAPVQTKPTTLVARAAGKPGTEGGALPDKGVALNRSDEAAALSVSDTSVQKQLEALLGGRALSQPQPQGLSQAQLALRDAKAQANVAQPATQVDVSTVVPTSTAAELVVRPERPAAKLTQSSSGLEGALGGATTAKTAADAVYEVTPTSAVVPDTQIAETVSYWVTHGVQNAELTLDGLGGEPVKVRISLDGDQAQVDFLSNQVEVRQVLESASAQLKELLSSEGLQLTGMSVGTSGQGGGQDRAPAVAPEPARQTRVVAAEPVVATVSSRGANPAVGQALDLFV